jgi:hypothetical protein
MSNMVTASTFMLATALILPTTGLAQEKDTAQPFVYGIYYECDVARQDLADEIVELVFAPAYDEAVEAGQIQSWGWLAHHTGAKWRRLVYHSAPTLEELLAAVESVNGTINERHPEIGRAFTEICGTHEDYIWESRAGSRGGNIAQDRGDAGFSVYLKCDMSRETRADEIIDEVFAPVYDRHVANGNLTSWGWMQHVVGGKWRRIATMTAADHATLLATRGAIIEELGKSHEEVMLEFDQICGSHQDYMWNIVHETP